ncbi:hypothetical protein QY97_00060 [Bacillus thermotolerans]|uniref:Uncharacterized protein n=1 Tax=Bacillus thermotolerans TaxID=1221996 RepID=A0A0F5I0X3_BACTR|nr:hypothetical protein QY97_00060 [Bacillus thermotolerans]KKB42635.1 hypothetical protein QY95_04052 [Bacillus thermotolerans]
MLITTYKNIDKKGHSQLFCGFFSSIHRIQNEEKEGFPYSH